MKTKKEVNNSRTRMTEKAKRDKRNAARREKRRSSNADALREAIAQSPPMAPYLPKDTVEEMRALEEMRATEDREPLIALSYLDGMQWTPEELSQIKAKVFSDLTLNGYGALPSSAKPSLLAEAHQIVTDRHAKYGHPRDDFQRIAGMWSALLDHPITPSDVARMMILLKIGRAQNSYQRDNMLDVVGYALCHEELPEPA
jgi:hypothetical protein